jgi:antitoxin component of RelBE/YafQ-DinJ toxin-antitoxin module
MKKEYDFSKGKRGPIAPIPAGKTRITIRIDDDVLDWFREQVNAAGGGNYQKLINLALREHVSRRREPLEATLRRVLNQTLREVLNEADEYGRAMRRQLRTMKKAKNRGLAGRPTWTRDELHERKPGYAK